MTNPRMTRKLAAALLVLSRHPGGLPMRELGSSFAKPDREALAGAGLIDVDRGARPMLLGLSDRGWRWLSEGLGEVVDPAKGSLVQRGFDVFVAAASAYLRREGVPFADVVATVGPAPAGLSAPAAASGDAPATPSSASGGLQGRLRAAYLEETGGRLDVNVVISTLRRRLPDVAREEVDLALRDLQALGGDFCMVDMENAAKVTAEMADGACDFRGRTMHLVRIAS